jgi:DNA-binding NarL/FixJ family response regulator
MVSHCAGRGSCPKRAGAIGVLHKDESPVVRELIEELVVRPRSDERLARLIEELTPRKREVMTLVARGLTNAQIARRLYLGEGTVKTHITSILGKLALRNRAQIVAAAYEAGLVRLGEAGSHLSRAGDGGEVRSVAA